jgi:hypothetical protein
MKSLLAAFGAGVIAVAMLATPAEAAPRCVWKGTYWQCWNGHSWYRDHHRRAEFRHDWRHARHMERDMYYGSSVRHDWRHDRHHLHYGR